MTSVPKYVSDILTRSWWDFSHPKSEPGYTIAVPKQSVWGRCDTLKKDIERLRVWVDRNTPEGLDKFKILYIPDINHNHLQYAVVTFYDPVMRKVENLICENKEEALKLVKF